MARKPTTTKKSNIVRADFSGVETSSVVPEGEYIAIIKKASKEESDAGNEYISWQVAIRDGKNKGKTLYHNTSLQPQSLWATKRWLESAGMDVPDGECDIDLDEMIDTEVGIIVEHETYKGRVRSRVVDSFLPDDEGGGAEEGGSEEAGLPSEDDIAEMGKADLRKLVEEHDLDVELSGTTASQRRQVTKALAEKAKGGSDKGGSKKKKKTVKLSEVNAMDKDGLDEVIETHELEVDLDKFATLRKQRGAVVDALEEAELLEDDSDE